MNMLPVPPHDDHAERAILGGILRDPDTLPDVLAVVSPPSMYSDRHQRILTAIASIAQRGEPVDLVTLHAELRSRRWLDDVGGAEYLAELWDVVPTAANAIHHARLIRDAATVRGLIHAANEILRDAYDRTGTAEELLAQAERKLFALNANVGADREPRAVGAVAKELLEEIDGRIAGGGALAGLSTGYADLDRYLGGMRPGEMIVLGARPSQGKTAMALNIAERVAEAGTPVLFFSLEQPESDIAGRLLSMQSGVPMSRMGRPRDLDSDDIDALYSAATTGLGATPLYIEDTPDMTAARVAALSRRGCRRSGVQFIAIDYLGLMRPENPKENRTLQIGTLALRVKQMARALNVPVLLLAQLNREMEHANRAPRLSDLRDSGEIEQHADRVLFLHREPNLPTDDPLWPVEVIVAKNRNGPTGVVRLVYRRPVLRFENAAIPTRAVA